MDEKRMHPSVEFSPLKVSAMLNPDETVLDAARRAGVPIGNACGAVGVCARCRVRVLEGMDRLGGRTTIEKRIAARHEFADDERLACQAVVRGDCVITTSYW